MPYAIRKIPLNWYRYDVQFSLNLLHSYVQSVEEQISKSIEEFRASQEVKNIQELRNTIVHANGKLKGRSGEQKNIAKYVKKSEHLAGDNEIKILEGYLFNVLETFGCQFQEIDEAIASSFQSS